MSEDYDKIGRKIKTSSTTDTNGTIKFEATFDDGDRRQWTDSSLVEVKGASRRPRWVDYVNQMKINTTISDQDTPQ